MKTPSNENDVEDNDNDSVSSPSNLGKRKGRPLKPKDKDTNNTTDDINFLDDESDLSFDEYMDTSDNDESSSKKQRGRGASKTKTAEAPPPPIVEEESDIEEAGEKKVNKDGHLLEGREYRVPTFELPNRGHQLFMFSKDPAALLNFRDSFVFIKKNPKLVKVYITDDEKSYLVETNKLRSTFRTREVSVVSARSVFKVFGHRVVKKGRQGRDDYYYTGEYDENAPIPDSDDDLQQQQLLQQQQQQLDSEKAVTGSTSLSTNMLQPSLTPSSLLPSMVDPHQSHLSGDDTASFKQIAMPISLKPTLEPLNTYNWLHHAAVSVRDFGAQLYSYRKNNITFYDIHTNVYQIPHTKQAAQQPKQPSST